MRDYTSTGLTFEQQAELCLEQKSEIERLEKKVADFNDLACMGEVFCQYVDSLSCGGAYSEGWCDDVHDCKFVDLCKERQEIFTKREG